MRRRSLGRRAIALGGPSSRWPRPPPRRPATCTSPTTAGNLHRFDARYPGVLLDSTPITGLAGGVSIVGMDFRPKTGDLVAVGSNSVVYTLDPGTAARDPDRPGLRRPA